MSASALSWAMLTALTQPAGAVKTLLFWLARVGTRSVPAVLAAGKARVTEFPATLAAVPAWTLVIGTVTSAAAGWRRASLTTTVVTVSPTTASTRPGILPAPRPAALYRRRSVRPRAIGRPSTARRLP